MAGRLNDGFGPQVLDLAFGLRVAAGIACIMMPAAGVVSPWFIRSRGSAIGIISAVSSFSAFLFSPLNAWLITSFGWRHALDIYGLIILLGIGPLGALIYGRHPADVSAVPYGVELTPRAPQEHAREPTLGTALRTYQFWAIFGMWGLGFIGPFLAGDLFDSTGDCQLAFAVGALAIIGSAVPYGLPDLETPRRFDTR